MTNLRLPRIAALLFLAIAVRAVTFGNPIVHVDEQFYFVVADAMRHGAVPYVDVWDRKSLGLFLVYLPAALFGYPRGIVAYQVMALGAVVVTAWLIAALADRAGWRRGAMIAASLYIVWLDLVDGQGGQAPVFYNALVVGAVLVAGGGRGRLSAGRGVAAMALIGLALQIKYSCVFEGAWIGLWLLRRAWIEDTKGLRWAGLALALGATAALPTALVALYYGLIGHETDFVFANFTSILARHSDPSDETIRNFLTLAVVLAPLLLTDALGLLVKPEKADARWPLLLRGWLVASVIAVLAFGSWFNHYALPVIAPAACCAAALIGSGRAGRVWGIVLLVCCAIAGQHLLQLECARRGSPAEFASIAAAIRRGPPGCLYIYGDDPMFYVASGRCTLSRYLFPSHLNITREAGSIGVEQDAEIARIFAQRPAVVVMRPPFGPWGETVSARALTEAALARSYRLAATLKLGRETSFVYYRR